MLKSHIFYNTVDISIIHILFVGPKYYNSIVDNAINYINLLQSCSMQLIQKIHMFTNALLYLRRIRS